MVDQNPSATPVGDEDADDVKPEATAEGDTPVVTDPEAEAAGVEGGIIPGVDGDGDDDDDDTADDDDDKEEEPEAAV